MVSGIFYKMFVASQDQIIPNIQMVHQKYVENNVLKIGKFSKRVVKMMIFYICFEIE